VGVRYGYYSDNREDALLMSIEHVTEAPFQSLLKRLKRVYTEKRGIQFSEIAD
jgi:hypothetical protein